MGLPSVSSTEYYCQGMDHSAYSVKSAIAGTATVEMLVSVFCFRRPTLRGTMNGGNSGHRLAADVQSTPRRPYYTTMYVICT